MTDQYDAAEALSEPPAPDTPAPAPPSPPEPPASPAGPPLGVHMEFYARRRVMILGRTYEPGQTIDDHNIPARVFQTLQNTNRVATRLSQATQQHPEAATSAGEVSPDPAAAPAVVTSAPAPDDAPEAVIGAWRALWERQAPTFPVGQQPTFRQYLMAYCGANKISEAGSIPGLVGRLKRNGIEPPEG